MPKSWHEEAERIDIDIRTPQDVKREAALALASERIKQHVTRQRNVLAQTQRERDERERDERYRQTYRNRQLP